MTCLSQTLQSVLDRNDLSAADLARKGQLQQSLLSRLRSGKRFTLTKVNFQRLLGAFSNKQDQADLVAAHLEDERFGPGSEFVKIFIERTGGKLEPVAPLAPRSLELLLKDLNQLAQTRPAVRTILVALHELLTEDFAASEVNSNGRGPRPEEIAKLGNWERQSNAYGTC